MSNRLSLSSSRIARLTVGVVAVTLLACGPESSAPLTAARLDELSIVDSASQTEKAWAVGDTVYSTFSVAPDVSSTYQLGGQHKLWIAAHGICRLDSPYGEEFWTSPCDPVDGPVTITAKSWTDADGHPHVEFSPNLRFVPTPLPNGEATAKLQLRDKEAAKDPHSIVVYCFGALVCVDEARLDPALETKRDVRGGYLLRPIRHFSGYSVTAGRETAFLNVTQP